MNDLSRLTHVLVSVVASLLLTGCTFLLPAVIPEEQTVQLEFGESMDEGADITIVMKDGTAERGSYVEYFEGPDASSAQRFASAVHRDTTLRGIPIPGDSVRMTVARTSGVFTLSRLTGSEVLSVVDRPEQNEFAKKRRLKPSPRRIEP